jgi:NAD(P)-dependent dehydrogenase (short-subunit alcohol dehydrogenase family)
VTGGANGIGRATALTFARAGAAVADLAEQANRETVELIERSGGHAVAVRCDVTKAGDVQAARAEVVEAFGRLDFAFNNAGIEQATKEPAAELSEEEWDRMIDVDLRGVFLCLNHEIRLMLRQRGGAIVTTSSGGVKGFGRGVAYAASKFGVVGLSKSAALD